MFELACCMTRSKSARSGLIFPVARIWRYMKKHNSFRRHRISSTAGVYLTAVLEYLTREVSELAVEVTRQSKKKLLTPRSIMLAVSADQELIQTFDSVILPFSGVVPHISQSLFPNRASSRNRNPPRAVSSQKHPKITSSTHKISPLSVLCEQKIARQTKLYIIRGSVTDVAGDVVVHPTSSDCGFNGQVGRALLRYGGAALQHAVDNAIRDMPPLASGDVRLTPAANIRCPRILHCYSPSYNDNDVEQSVSQLTSVIQRCLERCDSNNLRYLVLPSVGSGGSGYPKQLAAQTIVRAIKTYCDMHFATTKLTYINFVLYDQESIDAYSHELSLLR